MMKKNWRFFKRLFIGVTALVILLVVATFTYVAIAPQFGQRLEGEDLARMQNSSNYGEDGFVNLIETGFGSFGEMMSTMPDMFRDNLAPRDTLPTHFDGGVAASDSTCVVTWYGHSAFLIEFEGKRILIDPMLGEVASPIPFGSARWPYEEPIPMDELKDIDILIISHDHYDHLDHGTIIALKDEVKHFYTALGVGSHLKRWGVSAERITELDWWESADQEGVHLVSAPARHFSGRGITDRNCTQWASWVIKGENHNLYFSGDGGYGPHFEEIGEKEGPFDLAFMECGQYNEA